MEKITTDRLEEIFEKQSELAIRYFPIEKERGFWHNVKYFPYSRLDDRFYQQRLKDGAWRLTEELGEVIDCYRDNTKSIQDFKEEVADALHFITELSIFSGFLPYRVVNKGKHSDTLEFFYSYANQKLYEEGLHNYARSQRSLEVQYGRFMVQLSMTMNNLKNKPWKQKEKETDITKYRDGLLGLWLHFFSFCITADIKPQELYDEYFKKHAINRDRQEKGY